MADTPLIAAQILQKFESLEELPPTLKPAEQTAVREHLKSAGWGIVMGIRAETSLPIGVILSQDSEAGARLTRPGAIVGPYFFHEEYFPGGLGIYVPLSAEDLYKQREENF